MSGLGTSLVGSQSRRSVVNGDILSVSTGGVIGESALSCLTPEPGEDDHAIWKVNGHGPGWAFYADCHHQAINRLLRSQIRDATSCNHSTARVASQRIKRFLAGR